MGMVLAFQSAPRPASRVSLPRRDKVAGADILFFTGVRYERQGRSSQVEPVLTGQRHDGVPPVS